MNKSISFSNFWDVHPTLKYYFANRKSFCAWMARHDFSNKPFFTVQQIIQMRVLSKKGKGDIK